MQVIWDGTTSENARKWYRVNKGLLLPAQLDCGVLMDGVSRQVEAVSASKALIRKAIEKDPESFSKIVNAHLGESGEGCGPRHHGSLYCYIFDQDLKKGGDVFADSFCSFAVDAMNELVKLFPDPRRNAAEKWNSILFRAACSTSSLVRDFCYCIEQLPLEDELLDSVRTISNRAMLVSLRLEETSYDAQMNEMMGGIALTQGLIAKRALVIAVVSVVIAAASFALACWSSCSSMQTSEELVEAVHQESERLINAVQSAEAGQAG